MQPDRAAPDRPDTARRSMHPRSLRVGGLAGGIGPAQGRRQHDVDIAADRIAHAACRARAHRCGRPARRARRRSACPDSAWRRRGAVKVLGSAAPLTPSRTFSGRTAILTGSPALHARRQPRRQLLAASPPRPAPNSPLRCTTRPSSRLEAPVKLATNRSAGPIVELVGGRHLQQLAVAHDADAVAEHDGLGLVVRDIERGHAGLLDDAAQVVAQPQAQLGVEVGQRLVEQQQLRLVDEAARQRHALHLPARQRHHRPVGIVRQARRAPAPRRPCGRARRAASCACAADRRRSGAPSCAATRHTTGTPCRCCAGAAAAACPARAPRRPSPPMEMVPEVGCSRPATQRSVVVLPQPEGPSSTTISPASMRKLTSSTAAMPVANTLRSRSTFSSADITSPLLMPSRHATGGREGRLHRCTYCR